MRVKVSSRATGTAESEERESCHLGGEEVAAREGSHRDGVVVGVLGGVVLALEHVEHALRDDEATDDVDRRHRNCRRAESLAGGGREEAAAHDEHATGRRHAGDGVGDRHERRVKSWRARRNDVVSCVNVGGKQEGEVETVPGTTPQTV